MDEERRPSPRRSTPREGCRGEELACVPCARARRTTPWQQNLILRCTTGYLTYHTSGRSSEDRKGRSCDLTCAGRAPLALVAASPTLRLGLQTAPDCTPPWSPSYATSSWPSSVPRRMSLGSFPRGERLLLTDRHEVFSAWSERQVLCSGGAAGTPAYFTERILRCPLRPSAAALPVPTYASSSPLPGSLSTPSSAVPVSPCIDSTSRAAVEVELQELHALRRSGVRVGHVTSILERRQGGRYVHIFVDAMPTGCRSLDAQGGAVGAVEECLSRAMWWWGRWLAAQTPSAGAGGGALRSCCSHTSSGEDDTKQPTANLALHFTNATPQIAGAVCDCLHRRGLRLTRLHLSKTPAPHVLDRGDSSSANSQSTPKRAQYYRRVLTCFSSLVLRTLEELLLDSATAGSVPDWPVLLPHCPSLRRLVVTANPTQLSSLSSLATPTSQAAPRITNEQWRGDLAARQGLLGRAPALPPLDPDEETSGETVLLGVSVTGAAAAAAAAAAATAATTVSDEEEAGLGAGRPLQAGPPLQELCLENHRSLSRVSRLSTCRLLCALNLSWTDVTDEELSWLLPSLPFLRELHLDWCCYVQQVAPVLCLRPNHGFPSEAAVAEPEAWSGLRLLSLSGMISVDDDALAAIAAHTQDTLQALNLSWCRSVTNVAPLAGCRLLQEVTLPDGSVMNASTRTLSVTALRGLAEVASVVTPFLERLQLHADVGRTGPGGNPFATAPAPLGRGLLEGFSRALPYVETLDLSGCGSQLERAQLRKPCGFRGRVLNLSGGVVRSPATLEALLALESGGGCGGDAAVATAGAANAVRPSRPPSPASQSGRLEQLALRNACVLPMRSAISVVARHAAATLTTLSLTNTNTDSACLRRIAHWLPALAVLDVSHCRAIRDLSPLLEAAALQRLTVMDGVNTLHARSLLWDRGTGVKGLLPLTGKLCPEFRTLRLRDAGNMADADLAQLSSLGRWVTEVDLLGVSAVGPLTVAALSDPTRNAALACGSLHKVNLSFTSFSDAELTVLATGMGNSLLELRVHGCANLRCITALENCRRLRVLKMSDTRVEQDSLFFTLAKLAHLEELDIRRCATVTDLTPLTWCLPEAEEAVVDEARAASTTERVQDDCCGEAVAAGRASSARRFSLSSCSSGFSRSQVTNALSLTEQDDVDDDDVDDADDTGSTESLCTSNHSRSTSLSASAYSCRTRGVASVSQTDLVALRSSPPRGSAPPAVSPTASSLPVLPPPDRGARHPCELLPHWPPPTATSTTITRGRVSLPYGAVRVRECVASRLHRIVFATNTRYLLSSTRSPEMLTAQAQPQPQTQASDRAADPAGPTAPPPPLSQTPESVHVEEGMRGLAAVLSVMCPSLKSVTVDRFHTARDGGHTGDDRRVRSAPANDVRGWAKGGERHRVSRAEAEAAELADMQRFLPGVSVRVGGCALHL